MSQPDPDSSLSELDSLFRRMRVEPPSAVVGQAALGLPSRVAARLREENPPADAAWLRWVAGLAPLTLVCVAWALFNLQEMKPAALADPQTAGWLMVLFG